MGFLIKRNAVQSSAMQSSEAQSYSVSEQSFTEPFWFKCKALQRREAQGNGAQSKATRQGFGFVRSLDLNAEHVIEGHCNERKSNDIRIGARRLAHFRILLIQQQSN